MRDIIIDECEMAIAANTIQRDVDLMLDVMEEYIKILAEVQDKAIKDDLICAKLSDVAEDVKFCADQLLTNISPLGKTVNKAISRIEEADDFKFPNNGLRHALEQLMSSF